GCDVGLLLVAQLLGQEALQLGAGRARVHGRSSAPGPSSLRTSSPSIFCTLLLATNTVATTGWRRRLQAKRKLPSPPRAAVEQTPEIRAPPQAVQVRVLLKMIPVLEALCERLP